MLCRPEKGQFPPIAVVSYSVISEQVCEVWKLLLRCRHRVVSGKCSYFGMQNYLFPLHPTPVTNDLDRDIHATRVSSRMHGQSTVSHDDIGQHMIASPVLVFMPKYLTRSDSWATIRIETARSFDRILTFWQCKKIRIRLQASTIKTHLYKTRLSRSRTARSKIAQFEVWRVGHEDIAYPCLDNQRFRTSV